MKIEFLGGAGEVGASCVLLTLEGKKLVFDCGMRMNQNKDSMPDLRQIQEVAGVDAIFLSHAHMDHSGALPILSAAYPKAPIFTSHATKGLVKVLLYDSLKITDSREGEIPRFSEQHVETMLDQMVCFNPNYTFKPFNEGNIQVTFYSMGHIAGAVGVYVTSNEGSVFYTGDFSLTRQATVEGANIPKLRPDVLISESTYGDRLHANRELEETRLVEAVKKIMEDGGKVLIPAFALGRAQDIILILKRAMAKKQLPKCTVYVDGMVKDICRIYESYPNYLRLQHSKKLLKGNPLFFNDEVIAVKDAAMREGIVTQSEPCCIIASSGMLTGGASAFYAKHLMKEAKNFVAITGYQDEEAPGRKLLELLEGSEDLVDDEDRGSTLTIGNDQVTVNCQVGRFGLSAHADQTEILGLISNLSPRYVFLVHGNEEVIMQLGGLMQKQLLGKVYIPSNGEQMEIHMTKTRKQLTTHALPTLGEKSAFTSENTSQLWHFVGEQIGTQRGLVAEDFYYIWYGRCDFREEDIIHFNEVLLQSPYFEREMKRPFIYHAIEEDKLEVPQENEAMEANEMLQSVDSYFTSEMGLYKKGARFEEKEALLYFVFPDKVKEQAEEIIAAFEQATHWKVVINEHINQAMAMQLVELFLDKEGIRYEQLTYQPVEKTFYVKTASAIDSEEGIQERFKAMTGLQIKRISAKQNTNGEQMIKNQEAMEQNKAFWYVDQVFDVTKDKLYKKSIKAKEGRMVIELTFVTPQVGARYEKEIQQLTEETGWDYVINTVPNQNELQNIARALCLRQNILPKKISYLPNEQMVQIKADMTEIEAQMQVIEIFKEQTALSLRWV